ncbi:hypothetical protein AgCh_035622 [Apium graveolens]
MQLLDDILKIKYSFPVELKDHREKDLKIILAKEEHLEQYSDFHSVQKKDMAALFNNGDAADNHSGTNFDNWGSYDSEDNKICQSVADFKDVKSFENFNIIVNGLIVDYEIPHHFQVKYHDLCCRQKSYIRD